MSGTKSRPGKLNKKLRVPVEVDGIQVNHCKNPLCSNFQVPVKQGPRSSGSGTDRDPNYAITGKTKKDAYVLNYKCKGCGEMFAAKSNIGVAAEYERISRYLKTNEPSCKNTACVNHAKGIESHPEAYWKAGKTDKGTPRFQCKSCRKTFSIQEKPVRRQVDTHMNIMLFKLLVNKTPLKRILEITELAKGTMYRRLDFIHEQCMKFVRDRERDLLTAALRHERLYLSTDRQVYHVNWKSAKSRRNTQLIGIGTADNDSGYVFPLTVNYDNTQDREQVNQAAIAAGDLDKDFVFRDFAHYWLDDDYWKSREFSKKKEKEKSAASWEKERAERIKALQEVVREIEERRNLKFKPEEIEAIFSSQTIDPVDRSILKEAKEEIESFESENVLSEIQKAYHRVLDRIDTEISEYFDESRQLPVKGLQVHAEYTQYGHFFFLRNLLKLTGKVRFYMDQESGIRAAFMAAFGDRILNRTADGWYVRYLKDLIIDKKIEVASATKASVAAYMLQHPEATEKQAHLALIKESLGKMQTVGPWGDKWVIHPIGRIYEPEKAVCWLTDMGDYDIDHQANLFYKASMFGIDRFFMQARRRLSMIERPIKSASAAGRTWYGYSPYNPAMIQKMLDIFRVYYNYCLVGEKYKQTPAMRFGLAKGPVELKKILYL